MIIIPGILESFRSLKDKTLKIVFESNEPTPEQFLGIAASVQQFGYLAFKKEPFKEGEKKAIDQLETTFEDGAKKPSQRLRSVLYVSWQQDNKGFEDFDNYYLHKMNEIIEHFKSKLD